MIKKINDSSMKQTKIYCISLYSKSIMMISGILINTSLMIGWCLWATFSHHAVANYIKWFNNAHQPNSNLQISFYTINIIIFIVSTLSLILTIVPFIFLKTKNSVSVLFCLMNFIFAAIFVIFLIIFFIFRFKTFTFLANKKDGEITNTTGNFIILVLPWLLASLFAILLLINSGWLMINITSLYKSNTLLMAIAKPKTNHKPIIIAKQEADNTIIFPNVVPQVLQNNEEQQIANMETNNSPHPQELLQTKIISNPSSRTVHYTNIEMSQIPTLGAYHTEVVSPTAGTIKADITNSPTSEEKINDNGEKIIISSEPIIENPTSENTINTKTSYQSKNQGGFEIKENSYPQSEISNFNQQQSPKIKKAKTKKSKAITEVPKIDIHHWTLEQIETVWEKAEIIDGVNDKLYRKDYGGAWMFRDSFTTDYSLADNLETYSWTIVLHRPLSQQGTTELYNLDPMNIVNAKSKGANYPSWKTKISAKGNKNILKEQHWKART